MGVVSSKIETFKVKIIWPAREVSNDDDGVESKCITIDKNKHSSLHRSRYFSSRLNDDSISSSMITEGFKRALGRRSAAVAKIVDVGIVAMEEEDTADIRNNVINSAATRIVPYSPEDYYADQRMIIDIRAGRRRRRARKLVLDDDDDHSNTSAISSPDGRRRAAAPAAEGNSRLESSFAQCLHTSWGIIIFGL
jgi:hypothetical protein